MKQEDKKLLLQDLCCRLPYGVMVNVKGFDFDFNSKLVQIYKGVGCSVEVTNGMPYDIDEIKPYLFPLSSMTEEQKKECPVELSIINAFINRKIYLSEDEELTTDDIISMFDWLNKNHFDYRGLIEKELALDATGLNIYIFIIIK